MNKPRRGDIKKGRVHRVETFSRLPAGPPRGSCLLFSRPLSQLTPMPVAPETFEDRGGVIGVTGHLWALEEGRVSRCTSEGRRNERAKEQPPGSSPELHGAPLPSWLAAPLSLRSRAAWSCQAGQQMPMAPVPSSLALAWLLRAQTGLTSSSAAESLISRKARLLESRRNEAWVEGELFRNIAPLLPCASPPPPPARPAPPGPCLQTLPLRPEPGSSRLTGTPLSPPSPGASRSLRR